jgi:hypothetical protein
VFSDYGRIATAFNAGTLRAAWNAMVRERMSRPWDGRSRSGHVPFKDFERARDVLRESLKQNGLYVWGAWTGDDARVQYVGISRRLGKRISNRYYAGRISMHRPTAIRREINLAEAHEATFRQLPDDYTPLRKNVDVKKFIGAGIPVWEGGPTRLPRAERYAKVGLANLWYFLIPAPANAELQPVEEALVHASNAWSCDADVRGKEHGWPLLNVDYVKDRENPFLGEVGEGRYLSWLRGSWWTAGPKA